MLSLLALAKDSRYVAGLTDIHVFSIAIGSSVFSSLVWLSKEESYTQRSAPSYSFGFSAVINSFAAIRTALLLRAYSYGKEEASAALVMPAAQMACDLWGLLTERSILQPMEFGLSTRINYAAHLAGAGFGFVYYYTVLRR
ncbi:putative peptidase S54, rhomboid domain, Rhomboid-like superfamily [Septoria linicola]|nr:putative peptidase S54, rhomboid domain, Rhomboid-like superfamily [Septoria linicola]